MPSWSPNSIVIPLRSSCMSVLEACPLILCFCKSSIYRDRFLLLFQRLTRYQHFSKPAFYSLELSYFGSHEVINSGFPPLEDREKSLKVLAGHDLFGGCILTKEETTCRFGKESI